MGLNVLGGEVGVSGSGSVGIGAHADVGYKDGVLKFDIGASVGLGVSVGAEIDIGGMVDTICDTVESAWNGLKKGWKTPMVEEIYNPDRTRLSLEFVKKQAIKTSDKSMR